MAPDAFVVVIRGAARPDVLLEVLGARRRPLRVVEPGGKAPTDVEGVRALIVAGDATPEDAALVAACHDAGVPVLCLGPAADAVAALAGGGPSPVGLLELAEARRDGEDDDVFSGLVDGSRWLATSGPGEAPDGATVLARFADGAIAALRLGETTYGTWLRPDVDPEDGHPGQAAFLRAWSASLLGRFVDKVVGRTDEEAPWGRRGPPPEPAAGLYLNPA